MTGDEAQGAGVRFERVRKTYDGESLVVRDLDLEIAPGEFLTLLGPSGSGKTTTLMMLAGFETPTSGEIYLGGTAVSRTPPHRRGIGVVFQNYALFPHMSVAQNLAFPLEVRKLPRPEIARRVAAALAMVRMEGFEDRLPRQLSGGQQQRVAVARALVFEPKLVLMDEPLGALDKQLREQLQYELKRLHAELGVTIVYVTHDQGEALTMSDRIAVFNDGRIQQLDTPDRLYEAPLNAFVAGFIGEMNALPATVLARSGDDARVRLACGTEVLADAVGTLAPGDAVQIALRPERALIDPPDDSPAVNRLGATVRELHYQGDHLRVRVAAAGREDMIVKLPNSGERRALAPGSAITIGWRPQDGRALAAG